MFVAVLSLTTFFVVFTGSQARLRWNHDHVHEKSTRLTLCQSSAENEECDLTIPLAKTTSVAMSLSPHVKYLVKLEEPKYRNFGRHSRFAPYNCFLLHQNEKKNQANAFIIGGESVKDSVTIVYRQKGGTKIEFQLDDLLNINRRTPFGEYQGVYGIECDIIECSRLKGSSLEACPDFSQQVSNWFPDESLIYSARLPVLFSIQPTMHKTFHSRDTSTS